MKYIIYILFFVCFGLSVKAQSGFPSQTWAGWIKPVFVVPDSGSVISKRDTNWIPSKPGMMVTWFHAGADTTQWFWTGLNWKRVSAAQIDTTSLSNRINLKLNISDTASMLSPYLRKVDTLNKWVQNVYSRNDSLFKLKNGTETFVHTFPTSGSGTVTSVALSMPAAFTVSGSPITTSGTFNVSGAGTSGQYIRGDGTLATMDTSAIPNFFSKVRSEFSGTSPITYNSTTGVIGILNANSTGQKGAATFNNSDFTDNGSALISLAPIGSGGSCLNCQLTIDTKGRITSFADGSIFLLSNAPGAGDTLVVSGDTIKRIYASYGLISTPTASSIALRVDTTLIQKLITANNGLTKTGNNIQLGGTLIQPTPITSAAGANRIIYSGVSSFSDGAQLDVSTTGSAGIGVRGQTIDGRGMFGVATTGVGVYGTATGTGGYGLFGLSTLGNAIYGRADSGLIWEGEMVPHSNNTIITARSTTRSSQALGANGIGYSDDSYIQSSVGGNRHSHQIIYKLTDATDASYTSSFEFWNANNATLARKMAIAGNGQITLDQYTGTNFQTTDTSFNSLVVDGSGNVFKRTGDGGTTLSANNGVLNNSNVLQLGDISTTVSAALTGDRYLRGSNHSIFYEGNKTNNGNANIIYDDTLIASSGNPQFKTWIQFNSLNHTNPPASIGSGNIEDGTGHFNHTFNMGVNFSPSSGRINTNYSAIGIAMESSFQGLIEWHDEYINMRNTQYRLNSYTIDTTTNDIDNYRTLSRFYIKRPSDFHVYATLDYSSGGGALRLHTASNSIRLQIDSIQNAGFLSANSALDFFYLSNFNNWQFPGLTYANNAYSFISPVDPLIDIGKMGQTQKGNISLLGGDFHFTDNAIFTGGSWVPDNTGLPVWNMYMALASDEFAIRRAPAGGTVTYSYLVNIKNNGNFLIGTTTDNSAKLQIAANTTTNASMYLNGASSDVSSPINGMLWYNSTSHALNFRDNGITTNLLRPTLYSGDGTLAGNRTVTGSNNNLTFATIGNYRINSNAIIFNKNDATFPYTAAILGSDNSFQLGYTPTATVFSKGSGILIDTNNNASLGTTQIPSTAPLYATGGSTYVNGFQNQAGNFLRVDSITTNITATLTQYEFRINATGGNITITLPALSSAFAGAIGIHYVFKRLDSSGNTVTIAAAGANLIDGASSITLTTQYQSKELQAASSTSWDVK